MKPNSKTNSKDLILYMEQLLCHQPIEVIQLTLNDSPTFNDIYEFLSISGRGSFGLVISAIEKITGEPCAIKIVKKDKASDSQLSKLREESNILKSLNHKNIVKFREVYESKAYIFIVMDQLSGGSLADLVSHRAFTNSYISDEECSIIIKNILEGIKYMHANNYIHRDLKPDNLMLANENDLNSIKIVDFGLGFKFDRGVISPVGKHIGTLLYMPWEQAKSNIYGDSVDIWACGIIMYYIIAGKHPLYEHNDGEEEYLIKLEQPKWALPSAFNPFARHFFLHLCQQSAQGRYNPIQALSHPWITRHFTDMFPLSNEEVQSQRDNIEAIRKVILCFKFCAKMAKKPVPLEYEFAKDFMIPSPVNIKIITDTDIDVPLKNELTIPKSSEMKHRKLYYY